MTHDSRSFLVFRVLRGSRNRKRGRPPSAEEEPARVAPPNQREDTLARPNGDEDTAALKGKEGGEKREEKGVAVEDMVEPDEAVDSMDEDGEYVEQPDRGSLLPTKPGPVSTSISCQPYVLSA